MIVSLCLWAIISHISYLFIESYLYINCGNFIKKLINSVLCFCFFNNEKKMKQLWTRICTSKWVIVVYWQVSILSAISWEEQVTFWITWVQGSWEQIYCHHFAFIVFSICNIFSKVSWPNGKKLFRNVSFCEPHQNLWFW